MPITRNIPIICNEPKYPTLKPPYTIMAVIGKLKNMMETPKAASIFDRKWMQKYKKTNVRAARMSIESLVKYYIMSSINVAMSKSVTVNPSYLLSGCSLLKLSLNLFTKPFSKAF